MLTVTLERYPQNPIFSPDPQHPWEHEGAFNGCVVKGKDGLFHMVYRAFSSEVDHQGNKMKLSTIGYAHSTDGVNYEDRRQIIAPTKDWEKYGCEDPRITFYNEKYYIFYTALSTYPFSAQGIKVAVAITEDFQTFEKHPVTPFNAKAMALFPELINGKIAAIFTMNTDLPPAKLAIAFFDEEKNMWSPLYWEDWYEHMNEHFLHLMRDMRDQVELGAPPIKTEDGWLVIYSYIKNYLSDNKEFCIEAVLLDLHDPKSVIGRTNFPLLTPQNNYELQGEVPNVIFPSGALIQDKKLWVYYGAADTRIALATCDLDSLLQVLYASFEETHTVIGGKKLIRFEGNPILSPILELDWQVLGTFNPAAVYEGGRVHILYRGQSRDGTSVVGYASSRDGFHINENLENPIYIPTEDFEKKLNPGNSGCEDPRVTKIDDKLYMTYTAYDGVNPPRVALTSISVSDLLEKKWIWEKSTLISLPGVDDKDACIIKGKKGEIIAFHRLGSSIWIDVRDSLDFSEGKYLSGKILAQPRNDKWDNVKLGIAAPPLETDRGWLLLYHGVSNPGMIYRVGAMILDINDPTRIISRTDYPIFDPEMPYELQGQVPNVVFPCGAVVINNILYTYYGGADKFVGVATMPLDDLLRELI